MMIHALIYFINTGDGGIDLSGGFRGRTIIAQCKVNIITIFLFSFLSLSL